MDCKTFQKRISDFVMEKMNTDELADFLHHVENCKECREELWVSYSLMMAMRQMDEGTDLSDNYMADLEAKIAAFHLAEKKRRTRLRIRKVILAVLVILTLFLSGSSYSEKRGKDDAGMFQKVFSLAGLGTEVV